MNQLAQLLVILENFMVEYGEDSPIPIGVVHDAIRYAAQGREDLAYITLADGISPFFPRG